MIFLRTGSVAELAIWRSWFAWRPVRVRLSDGAWAWAWFERVERSWTRECEEGNCCWQAHYRLSSSIQETTRGV
jgi:hypothetical protein